METMITGRKCYDHLGGQLGARIFKRLLEDGWIQLDDGKTTVYTITEKGLMELEKLGIDVRKEKKDSRL